MVVFWNATVGLLRWFCHEHIHGDFVVGLSHG